MTIKDLLDKAFEAGLRLNSEIGVSTDDLHHEIENLLALGDKLVIVMGHDDDYEGSYQDGWHAGYDEGYADKENEE